MHLEAAPGPRLEITRGSEHRWYHKLGSVLFAIFCFEMGLFLLVFPWVHYWDTNYFASVSADTYQQAAAAELWRTIWFSPYFRGAVSGLGLLNLYISFAQVFRLRRFSPPPEDSHD